MTYHTRKLPLWGDTPVFSPAVQSIRSTLPPVTECRGPWNGKHGCAQADLYSSSLTWIQASRILLCIE